MFQGVLGASISKMIELSNPSQKKVGYTVNIEGSCKEFTVSQNQLVLPPMSSFNFPISLKPGGFLESLFSTAVLCCVVLCCVVLCCVVLYSNIMHTLYCTLRYYPVLSLLKESF